MLCQVLIAMCVCVCVCVKCTVVKILKSFAIVWPNFPTITKEDTIKSRMKVGMKEILLQREINLKIKHNAEAENFC
jgi:hypothetical protein